MNGATALKAFCLAILLPVSAGAHAQSNGQTLVQERLDFYHRAFPQMTFLWLRGQTDLTRIAVLPSLLGNGAHNEDYAHPRDARQTLIAAQAGRIASLLEQGEPSATLFRTGTGSAFSSPHVCVVTLDERVFLTDPLAASRFFLNTERVPNGLVLAPVSALRFTVDHEVFHCLDAYLHGPLFPITPSRAHAQYAQLRAEMRADYYAALMHRLETGKAGFVQAFARLRTLGLLDWDLAHYTRPALEAALHRPLHSVTDPSPRALATIAQRAVTRLLPTFAHFAQLRAAAYRAAVRHGSQAADEAPHAPEMAFSTVDPRALATLNRHLSQIVRLIEPPKRLPQTIVAATNTLAGTRNRKPGSERNIR